MALRRVYCETVSAADLAAPSTVALLRRFEVQPIVAVWPGTIDDARRALTCFSDAGLEPIVWPMLGDADGRWLGAANASAFCAFAGRVVEQVHAQRVLLDLEPPIAALQSARAIRELPLAASAPVFARARGEIGALVARLRDRGVEALCAVPPLVLLDRDPARPGWQLCLGTPVDGIAWDRVSPMLYASILEGWSAGLLRREDARAFVSWGARAAVSRFGARAGASLGAVGTGALQDEPTYRSPSELADDVAVATAAGVSDLALFDLGGVLRRAPAEAWLAAFTEPPSTRPLPSTARVDALLWGSRFSGAVYARLFPRLA